MSAVPAPSPVPVATILIVDKDPAVRHDLSLALAGFGYHCCEARSAQEAIVMVQPDNVVDVVICDIGSPSTSGLAQQLVSEIPELAIVLTATHDDPAVARGALDLGAFGYLIKPISEDELVVSVANALRRRDLESAQRNHEQALHTAIRRAGTLDVLLRSLPHFSPSLDSEDEIIELLERAVSLRDEDTGRHILRMSRYSAVLAEASGLSELSVRDLRMAAALHDVGEIGIPDTILLKPGPLTRTERAAMQHHARLGCQLVASVTSPLLHLASEVALFHHEWWNGNGYPRGLRGEDIREEGRIAAIADVFDALTSHRVYRPARPFDEAIDVMSDLRGQQFEPRLLDAFLGAMDDIVAVRETYPDVDEAPRRIRILVVDEHAIVAGALVRLLESTPEFKVIGTAGSVAAAVSAAAAYAPDVVLMDFSLPDGDGPEATRRIKAFSPSAKVVMLTGRTDERSLAQAIAAGCTGFITRDEQVDALVAAIFAAFDDEIVGPPPLLQPLLSKLQPSARGSASDLTTRERDILALTAAGLVNKEIAQRLGLSLNTVRNHSQNILYKLDAHSKLEAVATAVRQGIIEYPALIARRANPPVPAGWGVLPDAPH